MLACDFFVAVTLRFRQLYVFVVVDLGTRRIIHWNLTDHPTAEWTIQQFRMATPGDQPHRFLIHDRDSIYSQTIDDMLASTGLTVLKTPARVPKANVRCERLTGTIRRECLDWVIPLGEEHLRRVFHDWVALYNQGRPTRASGLAVPIRRSICANGSQLAIASRIGVELLPRRFWAGCITSIALRPKWREGQKRHGLLRTTFCGGQLNVVRRISTAGQPDCALTLARWGEAR
jgi:hypothetical protein